MTDIKNLATALGSKIILERPPFRPPPNLRTRTPHKRR